MSEKIPVLDHGYLMHVESWGSDERIIESARMSTGKGFLGWGPLCEHGRNAVPLWTDGTPGTTCPECPTPPKNTKPGDEKLLRFLKENHHDTPFEFAGCVIEVQAPIFVFREWHRHRTQSYNEMSARYTPLPDVNYVPSVERLMINSKTNKQAGTIVGAAELTEDEADWFRQSLVLAYNHAESLYQRALLKGVPKELARVHLPVGRYSRMRASANLRNWLGFLTLRNAPSAQWEIRQYAIQLEKLLTVCFPKTMELFVEKR
jgi:thymidylate synthase (FAD)